MRRPARLLALAATAALTVALPGVASAHPEHDRSGSTREQFEGEGVVFDKQHDGQDGHLPATQENVELVGKGGVTNPSGAGETGRVADVFAWKEHAFLTAFREPTCEAGGVHVMDISDLSAPREVTDAFIPTSPGSYAGEGIQVIRIKGNGKGKGRDRFRGDVLIHQNETCDSTLAQPGKVGGINLWDVSDPENAEPLALHVGDKDGGPSANTVHSMFAWEDKKAKRTFVALVDNEEFTDVDIMDITDPRNPVMVNDTLDLVELFGVDQASPPGLTSIFSHDMMVQRVGKRYVMNVNYWDGGYVLLDVTDPENVSLIAESDYAELDEERLKRGHRISPEGNAHQSELSPDAKFLIGTDEDFNPFRVLGTINGGQYAGTTYSAASASDTPPVDADTTISGDTTFVGEACAPLPPGDGIALVERGTCFFQVKLDNITDAGYDAGIVFNNSNRELGGCDVMITMAAEGTIPFVFVTRTTGLQLLDSDNLACETVTPAGPSVETTIEAVFDGWGYVRLFRTDIPRKGGAGSIEQIDTYAIEESQDPAFATGFGDLSVHEVAIDPDERLAYLSYYAGGLRVLKYGKKGLTEVGRFIDEGGNNFWGVEVYERDGENFVLASDRDFGLYVFKATP